MLEELFNHKNHIEESRFSTTFDGSLHSKMSILKFLCDIMDGLKARRYNNSFNTMKVSLTILILEMMKQSLVVIFNLDLFARIDMFEISKFKEV
jgi:hypothetical protein